MGCSENAIRERGYIATKNRALATFEKGAANTLRDNQLLARTGDKIPAGFHRVWRQSFLLIFGRGPDGQERMRWWRRPITPELKRVWRRKVAGYRNCIVGRNRVTRTPSTGSLPRSLTLELPPRPGSSKPVLNRRAREAQIVHFCINVGTTRLCALGIDLFRKWNPAVLPVWMTMGFCHSEDDSG